MVRLGMTRRSSNSSKFKLGVGVILRCAWMSPSILFSKRVILQNPKLTGPRFEQILVLVLSCCYEEQELLKSMVGTTHVSDRLLYLMKKIGAVEVINCSHSAAFSIFRNCKVCSRKLLSAIFMNGFGESSRGHLTMRVVYIYWSVERKSDKNALYKMH
ncbi:hypothetical protein SUGI_0245920 [Cryptomeria japonica]|nr:hypothetical protein SUGI_0245920 [Cryptomeria japonica]